MSYPQRGWWARAHSARLTKTQISTRLLVLVTLPITIPLFGYIFSSLLTSPLGLILFLLVVVKLIFSM
jgi:hypothetical protein